MTTVVNCLTAESRYQVDDLVAKALAAGRQAAGRPPRRR